MAAKTTTTTRTRRTRKTTKEEKPVQATDGAEKKPVKEKEPQASDENARPPMTRGRKLDAAKVRDIRARLTKGEKAADIAAVYDLHPSSVDDIRVGRTWASVD